MALLKGMFQRFLSCQPALIHFFCRLVILRPVWRWLIHQAAEVVEFAAIYPHSFLLLHRQPRCNELLQLQGFRCPIPVSTAAKHLFRHIQHDSGAHTGSVAKFDFGAKSQNWVSGIQWLTDANTLEKATLRQNRRKPSFASENLSRLLPPDCLPCPVNSQGHYQANKCEQKAEADIDLDCRIGT